MALTKRAIKQTTAAIKYQLDAALKEFDAAMALVDFTDVDAATKAAKNVMRGLVIKHGDVISRIAYEQYVNGMKGDAFEPFVWRGLSDNQVSLIEDMVTNTISANKTYVASQGKLRDIYIMRLKDVYTYTTLSNGIDHQTVMDFVRTSNIQKGGSSKRSSRKPKAAWDGVYWAREVTSSTPCDYCIMLASRGPVYLTKETAKSATPALHNKCSCRIIASNAKPEGYDERLETWKDWYANGVPEEMDELRKAKWEENRLARREEEKAAKEAANQSD